MINPAEVAVEGVGFGFRSMALLGWNRFTIDVLPLPFYPGRGGGDLRKKRNPELQTYKYKNTTIQFDPERDRDKRLVVFTMRMKNGDEQWSHGVIVDRTKADILIRIVNFVNASLSRIKVSAKFSEVPESIKVTISGLAERVARLRDYLNKSPRD